MKQATNAHISKTRQDIKISSTYLESAANFTSDKCNFVIFVIFCNFIKKFEKLQIIDLDDSAFFKIIYLRHEGSIIGVQCQLVICRGPF